MSNKSGTARFKRSAALDLTDENHPQEISTIIADHVWSGLNWPSQHSLPFDPQCRRVVTRETDPAYRNILNVLVCPARTDSAQSRHIIEQAWNDGDVVHVPWLLRGDGTLVLSPPYITDSELPEDIAVPLDGSFSSIPVPERSPTAPVRMTASEVADYMALTSGETVIDSFFISARKLDDKDPDHVALINSYDRGAQAKAFPILTEVQPVPRSGEEAPSIAWQEKHRSVLQGFEKFRKFSDESSFRRSVDATLSEDPYLYATRKRSEAGQELWSYWTRQFTGRATPLYYACPNGNRTQYGVFEMKKDAKAILGDKALRKIQQDGGATITRMSAGKTTNDTLIVSTTVQGLFQRHDFPPTEIEFGTLPPVSDEQEHRIKTKWRAYQAAQAGQASQASQPLVQ